MPSTPDLFTPNGLNFGWVAPSNAPTQTARTLGVFPAGTVSVQITEDEPKLFSCVSLQSVQRKLVGEPINPPDLPPGKHPSPDPHYEYVVVAQNDGSTPLTVEAGNYVQVGVQFSSDPNIEQSMHSPYNATLTVTGNDFTAQLPLLGAVGQITVTVDGIVTASPEQLIGTPVTVNLEYGPPTDIQLSGSAPENSGIALSFSPSTINAVTNVPQNVNLIAVSQSAPAGGTVAGTISLVAWSGTTIGGQTISYPVSIVVS
jgi:hypothetical protein